MSETSRKPLGRPKVYAAELHVMISQETEDNILAIMDDLGVGRSEAARWLLDRNSAQIGVTRDQADLNVVAEEPGHPLV